MYRAICDNFSKFAGSESLIPLESLSQANKIKLLQIVVKRVKRHFIFWRKVTYTPYDFQLSDVFIDPHSSMSTVTVPEQPFCKWNKTLEFSLSGKLGTSILEELADADLTGSDKVEIDAKLGQINITEIDSSNLQGQLIKRRINLTHPLIQQIRQKSHSVLCVVQSIVKLAQNAEIRRTDKISEELDAKVKIPGGSTSSISGAESLVDNTFRDIGLVKGTPIAYTVWRLQVTKYGGTIVPCMTSDTQGGFIDDEDVVGRPPISTSYVDGANPDTLETDAPGDVVSSDPVDSPDKVMRILQPLLGLSEVDRQKLHDLLLKPTVADFEKLDTVLNLVENRLGNPDVTERMLLTDIEGMDFQQHQTCIDFLLLAGFEFVDEDLRSPSEQSPLFDACSHLIEAMTELPDDAMSLIRRLSLDLGPALLHLIEQFLNGTPLVEFGRYEESLARDGVGMELLRMLNIQVDLERRNPLIPTNQKLSDCVDELYWWLCAKHRY